MMNYLFHNLNLRTVLWSESTVYVIRTTEPVSLRAAKVWTLFSRALIATGARVFKHLQEFLLLLKAFKVKKIIISNSGYSISGDKSWSSF